MTDTREQPSIVIAGGGLAGGAIALILREALPDIAVVLCDPAGVLSADAGALLDLRTTAFAPSTAELLSELDVWPRLAASPTPIESIAVRDQGHAGRLNLTRTDNGGLPLGYVVANKDLAQAMAGALRAAAITIQSSAVTRVLPTAGGVDVHIEGAEVRRAELAIIADGADSRLRDGLGIGCAVHDYRQVALIANAEFQRPHGGAALELFTRMGPLALLPLGPEDGRTRAVVWTCPKGATGRLESAAKETLMRELTRATQHRFGRCTNLGERALYPLRRVLAQEQVRSHTVVMGNAAHLLHPVAGQGLNLTLRDGLRLAEILRGAREAGEPLGAAEQLQRYESAQRADQQRTLALGHGFTQIFARRGALWGGLRALGFMALGAQPMRREFLGQMSGRNAAAPRWRKGAAL